MTPINQLTVLTRLPLSALQPTERKFIALLSRLQLVGPGNVSDPSFQISQWEQPRATAVSFATVIGFIFAARYLPLLRWAFKFLYMSLGCKWSRDPSPA